MAKTSFSDGNPLLGILGTIVNAAWLNKVFNHRHDGQDQDGSAPLDYAPDTGSANSYAIALTPALTAHVVGLPIHFKATNANTAASTLAVNGLAAIAIKQSDGSDLPAGAIVAGQMVTVIYTGAAYMMVSGRGVATDAEVQAGTDTTKVVTAGRLYNALYALATKAGFVIVLNSNGYIKFPAWLGGLIIQWLTITSVGTAAGNATATFPITFPNSFLGAIASIVSSGSTAIYTVQRGTATNTTLPMTTLSSSSYVGGITVCGIAVGY